MDATTTTEDDTAPPSAPKKLPMIMTALAALVVGGAAGAFGVGPMLGPSSGGGTDNGGAEPKAESGGAAGGHGAEGEAAAGTTFTLDGVIINPAGSRGQHHLIATIAFEVTAAADEPRLRAAEVPLRDAVGTLLEKKSLDVLTSPGIRDQLRTELRALAEPYLVDGSVKVYLPQYIVQ